MIVGRIGSYLRVRNDQYSPLWPTNLIVSFLTLLAWLSPTLFFVLFGGTALVRSRLQPERSGQAGPGPCTSTSSRSAS